MIDDERGVGKKVECSADLEFFLSQMWFCATEIGWMDGYFWGGRVGSWDGLKIGGLGLVEVGTRGQEI